MTLRCSITDKIPMWTSAAGNTINFSGSSTILNSFPYRRRFTVTSAGDLIIENIKQSDSGMYSCSYPGAGSERVPLVVSGAHMYTVLCSHKKMTKPFKMPGLDSVVVNQSLATDVRSGLEPG